MKKLIVMAVAAMVAAGAFAQATWIGNSGIYVNNGTDDAWYKGDGGLSWAGADFNGANLGELYSLTLGAHLEVYGQNDNDNWDGGAGQWLNYKVGDGEWKTSELSYKEFAEHNNILETQTGVKGQWAPFAVDISGLENDKEYSLSVWFGAVDGQKDGSDTQPYTATFTKVAAPVPEPATMSLLGLGALAMVLRRKLRK